MVALNKKRIRELIKKGLIKDYIELDRQLQSAGFDLTLRDVYTYRQEGRVDFDNSERRIAKTKKLKPDNDDWYFLAPGAYKILINESVSIPKDVVVLARTRSSLLRNGAFIESGVGDPGYSGNYQCLLVVRNPHGIHLKKYSRIVQLVFFSTEETVPYVGIYNEEGKKADDETVIKPEDTE